MGTKLREWFGLVKQNKAARDFIDLGNRTQGLASLVILLMIVTKLPAFPSAVIIRPMAKYTNVLTIWNSLCPYDSGSTRKNSVTFRNSGANVVSTIISTPQYRPQIR